MNLRVVANIAAAAALVFLTGCAPTSQQSLMEEHPPVTYHVDDDLFDVYQHTAYWVRECHGSTIVQAEFFQDREFATFRMANGPYYFYDVRLDRSDSGGTDVSVVSAKERFTRAFAGWTHGQSGCRPPGSGD